MRIKAKYLFVFLIFVCLSSKPQSNNINHVLGIGAGYSFYPKEIGYKGDIGLNYMFARKYFAINLGLGLGPKTNYKLISKYNMLLGFISNMDKPISWHLLAGITIATPYNSTYRIGNDSYIFYTGAFGINTGGYYRIKQSNFLLGLDVFLSTSNIEHVQKVYYQNIYIRDSHSTNEFWYLNFNLSLNYKFKNKSSKTLPFFINKNNHLVSLGIEYNTTCPKYVGYKGEINFGYLYAYKHFAFNFNAGIAPFTNFGIISKYSAAIGFTTRVERNLSWNLLFGYAASLNSKPEYFIDENHYYIYNVNGLCLSTGFYYKILESNLLLGFKFLLTTSKEIKTTTTYNSYFKPGNLDPYSNYAIAAFTGLSINYKLNFKK